MRPAGTKIGLRFRNSLSVCVCVCVCVCVFIHTIKSNYNIVKITLLRYYTTSIAGATGSLQRKFAELPWLCVACTMENT